MLAILTLLFAAIADNVEQVRLDFPGSPDTGASKELGLHLQSLLSHTDIETTDLGLVDIRSGRPLSRDVQINLLRWLHEQAPEWKQSHYLDTPKPRSMLYATLGRRIRPVVDWMIDTGSSPRSRGMSWREALREGMRHAQRRPGTVDARWIFGPSGIGHVVYRFIAEDPNKHGGTDNIYFTRADHPYSYETDTSSWSVQKLNSEDLIMREIEFMGIGDQWRPESADHWLSLRDGSGQSLVTFIIQELAPGQRMVGPKTTRRLKKPESVVHVIAPEDINLWDLRRNQDILKLAAEFLLFLQPDTDEWSSASLPLLLWAEDRKPLLEYLKSNGETVFSTDKRMAIGRAIMSEHRIEELPRDIFEIWYDYIEEEPRQTPQEHSRITSYTHDQTSLPLAVAQMQVDRMWPSIAPTVPWLYELDYELDEESLGERQHVYEARFVPDEYTPAGPRIIQVLLWWEGNDPEGRWAGKVLLKDTPAEIIADGVLDESSFFSLVPHRLFVTTADLRNAVNTLIFGIDRLVSKDLGLYPDQIHAMRYDPDDGWFLPE